jgi:hypothetical protein
MDEDLALSEISAPLQIQAIYRRFTGNREFRFFDWPPSDRFAQMQTPGRHCGVRALFLNSALNAMRRSHRECKRIRIYSRYSGV